MNKTEIAHCLKKMRARWPGMRIDDVDVTVEVWLEDLGDYDYAAVDAAIRRLVAEGQKWAPTTSEIIEALKPRKHPDDIGEPWMNRSGPQPENFMSTYRDRVARGEAQLPGATSRSIRPE